MNVQPQPEDAAPAKPSFFVPVNLSRCWSGLERIAEYVVTEMMLQRAGRVSASARQGRVMDVLVVVGDIAGQGGESNVGCERERYPVDGEAFGPFVPWEQSESASGTW